MGLEHQIRDGSHNTIDAIFVGKLREAGNELELPEDLATRHDKPINKRIPVSHQDEPVLNHEVRDSARPAGRANVDAEPLFSMSPDLFCAMTLRWFAGGAQFYQPEIRPGLGFKLSRAQSLI